MKMKKLLSLLLACAMILSLLAACGSNSSSDNGESNDSGGSTSDNQSSDNQGSVNQGTDRTEQYCIGAISLPGDTFATATKSAQEMCEAAGVKFITTEVSGYDDQGFLTTYENLINMGANGLVIYVFSEGLIRLLADLCAENGVDWFIANRQITSEELKAYVYENPYYVGDDFCEEEENAYNIVKRLYDEYGISNLAAIGLTQGDLNGDLRDAGIARACADLGINFLTETRGVSDVTDVTNAVEGIISSYPEVDSIFIVGGAITTGALAGVNQALVNHNMQDKVVVGMVDIAAGMDEYMGEGKPLKVVTGGNLVMDYILPVASLINHSNGINVDKEPYILNTQMLFVTTPEEAVDYATYYENPAKAIIPSDQWADTLLGQDLAAMQAWLNNFTIEYAKSINQ